SPDVAEWLRSPDHPGEPHRRSGFMARHLHACRVLPLPNHTVIRNFIAPIPSCRRAQQDWLQTFLPRAIARSSAQSAAVSGVAGPLAKPSSTGMRRRAIRSAS
ncbi:MAG TPA: hypothetical protein PK177_09390, partial [Burkholderiaceae bacterium]|nr:hypothetical protein [Burkholderiaceae bacterium]